MPVWETQMDDLSVALPAGFPIPLPLGSCSHTFPIRFLLLSLPQRPPNPQFLPSGQFDHQRRKMNQISEQMYSNMKQREVPMKYSSPKGVLAPLTPLVRSSCFCLQEYRG